MAQFCTKCGTPVPEGMSFCTGCGAPAGPPAAAAMATPQPGVAPSGSKGSPVMKIVLIVVGVIVLIGALMAASCVFLIYRARQRVHRFEKQVQMSFPANPRSTNQPGAAPNLPAVDLSSLAYPGATPGQGENQVAIAGGAVKMQTLFTSDSVDTVLAFYKNKLGDAATISQSGQQALVQSTGPNGIFNIAFSPDSASGKTKIVITSIGK